jgi:hypothetical protein
MAKATRGRAGATSPRPRPTPSQDLTPTHAVRSPKNDLRPWAAYSLGHDTRMLPYYTAQFSTATDTGRLAFRDIPAAADRVQVAADVLSETIPLGVLETMRQTWHSLRERACRLEAEFIASWDFPDRDTATTELATRATLLVDQAIPQTLPIARWFELGCAVGEFYQRDYFRTGSLYGVPFRPVAEAAHRIDRSERHDCPELQRVAVLLDQPESATEEGLRNLYVDRSAPDWPHPDELPWPISKAFTEKVRRLHVAIDDLAPPPTCNESPPQSPAIAADRPQSQLKPRWDSVSLQLWYGERLLAEFQDRCEVSCNILNEFEKREWKKQINDPNEGAVRTKGEHVRTLNRKVGFRMFRGGGSALSICWCHPQ